MKNFLAPKSTSTTQLWNNSDNPSPAPRAASVISINSVNQSPESKRLSYLNLPDVFRDVFAMFDEDGSGDLDATELEKAAKSYKDFSRSNGVYNLESFPADLQADLRVFDVDGNGIISAAELEHGCRLYKQSQQKAKRFQKMAMLLVVMVLLLLIVNAGLIFGVVWLMKDTQVSMNGVMQTKDGGSLISMGSVSQIISVYGDTKSYSKLRNETFDAFKIKPEQIGVTLSDKSAFNFPVDFMVVLGNTSVRVENTEMKYKVTVTLGKAPKFTYPGNSGYSVNPNAVLTHLKVWMRPGAMDMLGDGDDVGGKDPSELVAPKTNTADAAEGVQEELAKMANRLVIDDLNEARLNNPIQAAQRGNTTSWNAVIKSSCLHNRNHIDVSLGAFCRKVLEFGSKCVSNMDLALVVGAMQLEATRQQLDMLVADPTMAISGEAAFCIKKIAKILQEFSPAVHQYEPHEADLHQLKRHEQIKSKAFETHRGQHLLQQLKHRLFQPESYQEIYGEALPEEGVDCYMAGSPYTGDMAVTWNGVLCEEWTEEEDSELAGTVACRQLWGYTTPFCPVTSNEDDRQYQVCDVPHCIMSTYQAPDSAPLGNKDWDWGLERISQRDLSYDVTLDRGAANGAGVHCFVMDSGVDFDHDEFKGRNGYEYNAFTEKEGTGGSGVQKDDNGHGTFVAGIMAGEKHGVANGCLIHAVKVTDAAGLSGQSVRGQCTVNLGINWVIKKFKGLKQSATGQTPKAVINIGLSGDYQEHWDTIVELLTTEGIMVVVPAGNRDQDACTKSPAHVAKALTVGATNLDDSKALFSNYGACVDIFAPGAGIKGATAGTTNQFHWLGGTSVASPFAAGAAAIYLSTHPAATPAHAIQWLSSTATTGHVFGLSSTYFKTVLGMTDEDFVALGNSLTGGKNGFDEVSNMAATTENKLLYVPEFFRSSSSGALTQCPAGQGYTAWTPEGLCPPGGAENPICGRRTHQASGLLMPVVKATRKCDMVKYNCVCEHEVQEMWESCDPKNNGKYAYLEQEKEGCGIIPAMEIRKESDLDFLQGRVLRYVPKLGFDGTSYDVCNVLYNGGGLRYPYRVFEDKALSLTSYFSAHNYLTISMPLTFKFRSRATQEMREYNKLSIHTSGHVHFHNRPSEVNINSEFAGKYTLSGHFSYDKTESISMLYTNLGLLNCGLNDCGDVTVWAGSVNDKPAVVLSFIDVFHSGAQWDTAKSEPYDTSHRSTFQLLLYGDGSGTFEVVYDKVSYLSQGSASLGVSDGSGTLPPSFSPLNSQPC